MHYHFLCRVKDGQTWQTIIIITLLFSVMVLIRYSQYQWIYELDYVNRKRENICDYCDCANKLMLYSLSLQKYFKYQHTQKINWLWSYSYKLILFREFKVNCRLMITPHFLSNYLCTNSNNLLLPRRWQISVKLHVITCKEGSHCLNWPKHNNSFMNCIFVR